MSETKDNFFIEVFKFSIITLVIVLPFRMYIAKPFIVSGASMSPNFETGNYLIVDQVSYRFQEPQRGEIIVFKYPKDPSRFFIKRIIGLPGETVDIKDGIVTIINKEFPKGFQLDEEYLKYIQKQDSRYLLSNDEYFVMGDNRPNSSDSRRWGALKKDLIVGRAFLQLLPITQIELFPENFDFKN